MKDKEYTHIYLGRKISTTPSWVAEQHQEAIESNVVVEMPIRIPVGSSGNDQEQNFIVGWLVDEFPNWKPLAYCSLEEIP